MDNFKCVGCGRCCETLQAVKDEKTRRYLLPCIHYNIETKLCNIYEDRPDICRNFPTSIECMKRTGCEGKIIEESYISFPLL